MTFHGTERCRSTDTLVADTHIAARAAQSQYVWQWDAARAAGWAPTLVQSMGWTPARPAPHGDKHAPPPNPRQRNRRRHAPEPPDTEQHHQPDGEPAATTATPHIPDAPGRAGGSLFAHRNHGPSRDTRGAWRS